MLPCSQLRSNKPVAPHVKVVDLAQLYQNVRAITHMVRPAHLCAVLKHHAYGHGLQECASVIIAAGATTLGVISNEEVQLIRSSPDVNLQRAAVLRIRPPLPAERQQAFEQGWRVIEPVGSLVEARQMLDAESDGTAQHRACLELDVSMGRSGLGVPSHQEDAEEVCRLLGQRIHGVMTHLANADGDDAGLEQTNRELDEFEKAVALLRPLLSSDCIVHAGNSAASLRMQRVREMGMVRCGAMIFGAVTSPLVPIQPLEDLHIRPCFAWKTFIAQIRILPPGARVGYGSTYETDTDERMATLPIGYCDGLHKGLSNGIGVVLIRGTRCPIRGKISSAMTSVSIQHLPDDVGIGEEVVLIGKQRDEYLSPDQVAWAAGTGHLDVQSSISAPIEYAWGGHHDDLQALRSVYEPPEVPPRLASAGLVMS